MSEWLLYGAYGYTGRLLAREALRRGHRPVLAGRSREKLVPLAEELGLPWAAIDLNDRQALREAVEDVRLVFHAAGPFRLTSQPMLQACLAARAHYLDITGELSVFRNTFAQDAPARKNGIALVSGAGFDVIPTDCLAAQLAARLPGANCLELAVAALSQASAGTMESAAGMLADGGWVRREGEMVPYPLGAGARVVSFAGKERVILPTPLGDLETAFRSTAIPNITTYMAVSGSLARALRLTGPWLVRLAQHEKLRSLAARLVRKLAWDPGDEFRRSRRSYLWGGASRLENAEAVEAWLEIPEAYLFTALAGVRCVEKLLGSQLSGSLTPSQAFGADFVQEIVDLG